MVDCKLANVKIYRVPLPSKNHGIFDEFRQKEKYGGPHPINFEAFLPNPEKMVEDAENNGNLVFLTIGKFNISNLASH